MDMSMSSSTSSSSSMDHSTGMSMTFFTSTTTPLFSTAWTPQTVGQYAGTCIFLIVLSFLLRFFYAVKCRIEASWHARDLKRRYIHTRPAAGEGIDQEDDSEYAAVNMQTKGSDAVLTVNGVTERVKVVQSKGASAVQPFRLSVDLVRAVGVTIMVGVGYLL